MGFGFITQFLGASGIRTFWKLLLIADALVIIQFPKGWIDFIDIQVLDLPLFTGRNILFVLTLLFAYMMHKNQF